MMKFEKYLKNEVIKGQPGGDDADTGDDGNNTGEDG